MRITRRIIAGVATITLLCGAHASYAAPLEQVESFEARYEIDADASVRVEERIRYNFGELDRHGIFRNIPVRYQTKFGSVTIRLDGITVNDEDGTVYETNTTRGRDTVNIRIGDPDMLVRGVHTYVISYRVSRAINYQSDHDEFYWNVTGHEWTVPIAQVSASVVLPEFAASNDVIQDCYAGEYGGMETCLMSTGSLDYQERVDTVYFAKAALAAGEGLTIVASFPKGMVAEPTWMEDAGQNVADNWIVVAPLIALIVLIVLWRKHGRDPKGKGLIIAQYDAPDQLTPLEAGVLLDETAHDRDLSAEILQLAIMGYVRIIQLAKSGFAKGYDYIFEKLKEPDANLKEHQAQLLAHLWAHAAVHTVEGKEVTGAHSKDLQNVFYRAAARIRKDIYSSLRARGYFTRNPQLVRAAYMVIALCTIPLAVFSGVQFGAVGAVSMVATGVIIVLFSFLMPKRTYQGVLAREHILGLREYITVAEKDRIAFHNAPDKSPQLFEKLLPFAMVFGAEKAWVNQFAKIYTTQPSWYYDPTFTGFNPAAFGGSLHDFSAAAKSFTSAPAGGSGASGGGFSGGGFGGGGGGSW